MRITKYVLGLDGANRFDSFYIPISPDAEAAVSAIIAKYPQAQMVNLCDSFANDAGKLNPQVEYIRLSLLSPFVHGKYRMGKPYGSWPLVCTGLYLISRSGAELLLKQFEGRVPGTVADDFRLYQQWGVDVRLVQPGLCGWEGSSVILASGKRHLDTVNRLHHGTGPLDRVRIALAPKKRIANAKNALEATLDEVKQRFSR